MPNIIGYKDLSNLYIKPAAEPTRTISDIDLKSASEPERVLNPIVSESYMRQYIEEHGGITPTGNIEITENTTEPLDIAQYATATVNVSGESGLNKYVILPETELSSTVFGEMVGIFIPDLYFFYPEVTVIIDGVSQKLFSSGNISTPAGQDIFNSNTIAFYPEGSTQMKMVVTRDYAELGLFSGTGILMEETEPTSHTVEIYYESQYQWYCQVFQPVNSSTTFYYTGIIRHAPQGVWRDGVKVDTVKLTGDTSGWSPVNIFTAPIITNDIPQMLPERITGVSGVKGATFSVDTLSFTYILNTPSHLGNNNLCFYGRDIA